MSDTLEELLFCSDGLNAGNHVLKNYMQDENTSADTKAWLNDFAPFAKASSFKRNKSLEMELEVDPSLLNGTLDAHVCMWL